MMAYNNISCVLEDCDNPTSSCIYTCFSSSSSTTFPLPLPLPPPRPPPPSQSHVAPFLIATVCILGISFLLLSTCTIILRYRFSFRRRRDPHSTDEELNGGGGGGGPSSSVDHPIWNITTVGLHQSVIDSITAFKYKKIDDGFISNSCSVCLTEFDEGDDLRLLPKCTHAFHVCCIDTWLLSHKNCPLCRGPVVSNDVADGDRLGVDVPEEGGSSSSSGSGSGSRRLSVLEGIRLAEILKKNRELRIYSDLGENHRFRGVEEGVETVRRSVSMNGVGVGGEDNEGSCSVVVVEEKKVDSEKGGMLMKSSSIDRWLQKGPVSMKRSLSSSSRFFSFRRTKSQASILPL